MVEFSPFGSVAAGETGRVKIRGRNLIGEGHAFRVKGVHCGPWRAGTGPDRNHPYPAPPLIETDLHLIRKLNANTIMVFDPPGYTLDIAWKYGRKEPY